jgi:Lipocalin-like domain
MSLASAHSHPSAAITGAGGGLGRDIALYSGKYTIEGNRMAIRVDMSWNEIYSGANQNQIRFFNMEGDILTIRSPEIVSAVRPGQKAVATLTLERER